MTIGAGETILAADIQAIKDDVDKLTDTADDTVGAAETTTSTSYTDLTTSGPAVTLTTGTLALVFLSAQIKNNTAGSISFMSFEVSGATTTSADNSRAIQWESDPADQTIQCSVVIPVTLTAGSNTFTMKYRVNGGTGSFGNRRIMVLPIGA